MTLTVNNNLMALNAARNLGTAYGNLSTSIQRMSSGLRINNASDDAAGLAIREMMRSEITAMHQGLRNAADAISLIQTADGALAVIDEKLIRMKELAEQAATGTYTTAQRDIINSEYQAMAREIDRIANSSNFNGVKLLDGSISNQHGGQGIKIHFGTGNSAAEDYYFINMGDARATSNTGLRIGGDAKNDVWGQGGAGAGENSGPGCCTAGFSSLNGDAGFTDGQSFSYGYNWDWKAQDSGNYTDTDQGVLLSGKYLAGRYTVSQGESLQDLVDKVNAGTQSRVGIAINNQSGYAAGLLLEGGSIAVCVGDEAYVWGDMAKAVGGMGIVTYHTYQSALSTLFGNSFDNTILTTNGTLAAALGLNSATVQAVIKDIANDPKAIEELNRLIDIMNNGSVFLSAKAETLTAAGIKGFDLTSASQRTDLALSLLKNYMTTETAKATAYEPLTSQGVFSYLRSTGTQLSANAHATTTVSNYVSATAARWDKVTKDEWTITDIYFGKGGGASTPVTWTNDQPLIGLLNATEGTTWNKSLTVTMDNLVTAAGGGVTAADLRTSATQFNAALVNFLNDKGLTDAGFVNDIDPATNAQINFFGHVASSPAGTSVWTDDTAVATAIGLSQATFTGNLENILNLGNNNYSSIYLDGTPLTGSNMNTMNTKVTDFDPPSKSLGVGIFGTGSGGYWTADANLASVVPGLQEITISFGKLDEMQLRIQDATTGYNQEIQADIMKNAGRYGGGPISYFSSVGEDNIKNFMANEEEKITGFVDQTKAINLVATGSPGDFNSRALATAINQNKNSQYWAMLSSGDNKVYVFRKDGGDHNDTLACEATATDEASLKLKDFVAFENVETGELHKEGTNFTLGTNAANVWAKMTPLQTKVNGGTEVWNVSLRGRDVGTGRDLWLAATGEMKMPGIDDKIISGLERSNFVQVQDAEDGQWAGADLRTQSNAQAALAAVNDSIDIKDKIRADLGALQNRLENTMTALEIQAENLQASESRISDVDVAKEMTAFTRNNVMVQASVGMLAQANSLSQLALSLIR